MLRSGSEGRNSRCSMPVRRANLQEPPQPAQSILYARVSSKDQEKEGFSIPAQLRLLREYAVHHGLTVAEEFIDVETAKQSGRPAFAAMVAYLKKHHAKCRTVLVEMTDRLYRTGRIPERGRGQRETGDRAGPRDGAFGHGVVRAVRHRPALVEGRGGVRSRQME